MAIARTREQVQWHRNRCWGSIALSLIAILGAIYSTWGMAVLDAERCGTGASELMTILYGLTPLAVYGSFLLGRTWSDILDKYFWNPRVRACWILGFGLTVAAIVTRPLLYSAIP